MMMAVAAAGACCHIDLAALVVGHFRIKLII